MTAPQENLQQPDLINPTVARVAGLIISPYKDFYLLNRLPQDHQFGAGGKLDLMTVEVTPENKYFYREVMEQYVASLGLALAIDRGISGEAFSLKFYPDLNEYRFTQRLFFSSTSEMQDFAKLKQMGYETWHIDNIRKAPPSEFRGEPIFGAVNMHNRQVALSQVGLPLSREMMRNIYYEREDPRAEQYFQRVVYPNLERLA